MEVEMELEVNKMFHNITIIFNTAGNVIVLESAQKFILLDVQWVNLHEFV